MNAAPWYSEVFDRVVLRSNLASCSGRALAPVRTNIRHGTGTDGRKTVGSAATELVVGNLGCRRGTTPWKRTSQDWRVGWKGGEEREELQLGGSLSGEGRDKGRGRAVGRMKGNSEGGKGNGDIDPCL
eukprot:756304-Hanusia_phi.AAC.1